VADICAAAEIAPRTFHRYFAGKEDVVAEPLRRMAAVVAGEIADARPGESDVDVLRVALLALGRFAMDHRDLLIGLRQVAQNSRQIRAADIAPYEQETQMVALLAARHPGDDPHDWRRRLLVGCAIAAYRVWYDDYLRDRLGDPTAHLETILREVLAPPPTA
jgi:AcrR family transcriptional regulator